MVNIIKKYFGVDIRQCKFLGRGREGKVYKTYDNYVIKLFKNKKSCIDEYKILKRMEGSECFPKTLKRKGKVLMREYVDGIPLKEYIRERGMPREIAYNLVNLLEEFKNSGFTRIDMSMRHIYVQEDSRLKIIDPRKAYIKVEKFPKILLRELEEENVVDEFIKAALDIKPVIATQWIKKLNS